MAKMNTATFLKHLDVLIGETIGSAAMNEVWKTIMLDGDGDAQADIAGHVLASTTLGAGNWHLECGGELAVNTARKTLINFCGDDGPELLVGDAALACLAKYGDVERADRGLYADAMEAAGCEPPAIDNKTWMPVAEIDPVEDDPDADYDAQQPEDDHFTLGCPSRA